VTASLCGAFLGALFIADAATLDDWTAGVPPLVDDRPGRLRPWAPPESDRAVYRGLQEASACAERSPLRTLPLLLMDSEPRLAAIARARHAEGERHPVLAFHLGAAALAERDHAAAAHFFEEAGPASVGFHSPVLLRSVALRLAGRGAEALTLAESLAPAGLPPHARPWRDWLIAFIFST